MSSLSSAASPPVRYAGRNTRPRAVCKRLGWLIACLAVGALASSASGRWASVDVETSELEDSLEPLALRISAAGGNCAEAALGALLALLGREVPPTQLAAAFVPPQADLSFVSMKQAAAQLDPTLDMSGFAGTLGALAAKQKPFIAHVERTGKGHFVVAEHVTRDWVRLVDDGVVRVASRQSFEAAFTGRALVPGPRLTRAPASTLGFDSELIDLGRVFPVAQEVLFPFVNRSERPVRLGVALASRGCAVIVPPGIVKPAQNDVIKVLFTPHRLARHRDDQFWVHVLLSCDDPTQPRRFVLSVGGTVIAAPSADPERVYLGPVRSSAAPGLTRHVAVKCPTETDVLRVATSCNCVQATVAERTPSPAGMPGAPKTYDVTLAWSQAPGPGENEERLFIQTTDPADPELQVPILADWRGPVEWFPRDLFFGSVRTGEKPGANIAVTTDPACDFDIVKVLAPSFLRVASTPVVARSGMYRVEVVLDSAAVKGIVRGDLILQTNIKGGEELRIPYYAEVLSD